MIVPAAIQLFALYVAWMTVRNTTRVLFDHAERRAAQAATARAELSDARMSALQARMQPHFLFNALNTIAELVRTDPGAAEATVEDLSAILRASLKQGDATSRPLREELALVRAFVGVEQRRLGARLAVRWNVAPDVARCARAGAVAAAARRERDQARYRVADRRRRRDSDGRRAPATRSAHGR